MRDEEYIKMCNTDMSANSRMTNDNIPILSAIIGLALLILAIFGILVITGFI